MAGVKVKPDIRSLPFEQAAATLVCSAEVEAGIVLVLLTAVSLWPLLHTAIELSVAELVEALKALTVHCLGVVRTKPFRSSSPALLAGALKPPCTTLNPLGQVAVTVPSVSGATGLLAVTTLRAREVVREVSLAKALAMGTQFTSRDTVPGPKPLLNTSRPATSP